MNRQRGFIVMAALALILLAGLARASDNASPESFTLSPSPVYASAASRRPLMYALDQMGAAGPLDELGITIGGHVEGGWTYNFDTPEGTFSVVRNFGRSFDVEYEDPTLNQVDLFVERAIQPSGEKLDLGGRVEWIWGGDARFIHANGLFDSNAGTYWPYRTEGPDEQLDPLQAYLLLNIPVGNGLLLKAGKFVTPLGYESINPLANPLYSHSFLFNFAIPRTHTGIMAIYPFDENWKGSIGIVRGWDQALEDNNDSVSFLGSLAYTSQYLDLSLNLITGPEQQDNDSNYRTVVDLILTYRVGDNLSFTFNGDYGWEPDAGLGPSDGKDAWWAGAAGYATYQFSDMLAVQGRLEFFRDGDASRLFLVTELWAAAIGLNIKPLPNDPYGSGLVIRPEVRWDHSQDRLFNDFSDRDQFTFGIDAIYAF